MKFEVQLALIGSIALVCALGIMSSCEKTCAAEAARVAGYYSAGPGKRVWVPEPKEPSK